MFGICNLQSEIKEKSMANILEMPKLTDTMSEGIITHWLVREGEPVTSGEGLLEIETDKANVTYESFENGYLKKILVPGGQAAALGQPIAVITEEKDEDISALLKEITNKKEPEEQETILKPEFKTSGVQVGDLSQQSVRDSSQQSEEALNQQRRGGSIRHGACISPIAKKIIKEKGIETDQLKGTGPNGRIIKRDVLQYLDQAGQEAAVDEYKDIPLTMTRKTIAARMVEAKRAIPHYYLTVACDLSLLSKLRRKHNETAPEDEKVSFNAIFMKIAAKALLKHPVVNSSFQGNFIRQYNTANISVAVAIENGLVVPTLFHVEQKDLKQIGLKFNELVKKARDGKLSPEEMTGGTFCISNLGMYGIEEFSAVINPPQAAILALGKIEDAPAVEQAEIKIVPKMKATLSCDHRVIDGREGAVFLSYFKTLIENPLELVL